MESTDRKAAIEILAPLSGRAIPLEQIGDDVFSRKLLGDGVAILPNDGKLLSPVDGTVCAVMDTLHAYCFATAQGQEILVHVGLESVRLNGAGFTSYVHEGDRVRAGQLIAQVDLALLTGSGASTVTPVVVCEGAEGRSLHKRLGEVEAGKTVLLSLAAE